MLILTIVVLGYFFSLHKREDNGCRIFNKDYTDALRGTMSLLIIICHAGNTESVFTKLLVDGSVLVGVFFFLSGFGLTFSVQHKPGYLEGFWQHNILKIAENLFVATIVYSVIKVLWNISSPAELMSNMLQGYTPASNSWYMAATLIIYVLYYIALKVFKNRAVLGATVCTMIYIICIEILNWPGYWNNTVILFLFGSVYAEYKETIDKNIMRHGMLLGCLAMLIYLTSSMLVHDVFALPLPSKLHFVLQGLQSLSLVVLFIAISSRFSVRESIFVKKLAQLSMYTYLYHGLCIIITDHFFSELKNSLVSIIFIIAASVLAAWLFCRLDSIFLKAVNRRWKHGIREDQKREDL